MPTLMLKTMAIIPARGGSTRLKDKNIYPVCGRPMIEYAIRACLDSTYDIDPWVTTDSVKIGDITVESHGTCLWRPPRLCGNDIYKMAAVRHAACAIEEKTGIEPDICVVVQPNSPEIKAIHLDQAINMLIDNDLSEVFSVGINMIQNGAFRIMKWRHIFERELSTYCGVYVCDLVNVHTIEDVREVERRWMKK